MKFLVIMTVCLSSLVLYSFVPALAEKKPKIKLIRPYPPYYEVTSNGNMNEKDLAKSEAIIAKLYNVKDFNTVKTWKYINISTGKLAVWVYRNEKSDNNKFTQKTFCGGELEKGAGLPAEIKELNEIFSKYAVKE